MEITEKLYIDRLEKMIKKYSDTLCDHCPMMQYYSVDKHLFITYYRVDVQCCYMCKYLVGKYTLPKKDRADFIKQHNCPCYYFDNMDT